MSGIIVTTPPTVELPPGSVTGSPALPPVSYQYAVTGVPQTWTALQTFNSGIVVNGTSTFNSPQINTPTGIKFSDLSGAVPISSITGLVAPQGRITLTSGTAVMGTSVAAATTVYYTPYAGNICPIYDGTNMVPVAFSELSQATTGSAKSPAACVANSNYDLFVWNDSGTIRCTRGPLWASNTSRGTGAGTTELQFVNGIYLNKNAITNGPAANRGTYVGTIRTNGTATVDYVFGTLAANGGMATFGVWNAYNRVDIRTMVGDSTDSWTYSVAAWQAANNSATIRVNMVRGLDEDAITAEYCAICTPNASSAARAGIGLDSVSAFSGTTGFYPPNVPTALTIAKYSGLPGIGFHFVSALEYNVTGGSASTWFGDAGTAITQTGIHVSLRA